MYTEPALSQSTAAAVSWNDGVTAVDPETVETWMENGEAFLVDVREPHEFEESRIPGAFLVPMSRLDVASFPRLRGLKTVLVCRTSPRAVAVSERLTEAGFEEVFIIDGGLEAWAAAGLEIEE